MRQNGGIPGAHLRNPLLRIPRRPGALCKAPMPGSGSGPKCFQALGFPSGVGPATGSVIRRTPVAPRDVQGCFSGSPRVRAGTSKGVSQAQLQVTRGGVGKLWTLVARKGTSGALPLTRYGGGRERAFARVRGANRNEEWTRGSGPSCVSILCVYPVCLSCVYPNRGHPCVHLLLQFVM